MQGVERSPRRFRDVVEAWEWLNSHPAFDFGVREVVLPPSKDLGRADEERWRVHDNAFAESLMVEFARVNPVNGEIDDDDAKNTQFTVWLDAGPPFHDEQLGRTWRVSHNHKLGCGAPTFEAALLQMAANVLEHYGDYEMGGHDI
jgi:hypothetical protein